MDTLRVESSPHACVVDSGALRALFGKENRLHDRNWLAQTFDKIVAAMIANTNRENGGHGEKKKNPLVKVGGVVEYELNLANPSVESNSNPALIFSQGFIGASLTLKTEPESNSFIVILIRFGIFDCGSLNGEVGSVVPEASIKHCPSTRIYG
ncbi:MAG: hypothetical protein PHE24_02095 [Patescibacteria group bacterium]|nr:hypothetical protein [Patescibacteria group bacterium]